MAEYIPREALVHRLKNPYLFNITQRIFDIISEIPAADVAPVVHVRWVHDGRRIESGIDWCHCSECGKSDNFCTRTNYCPNCGAKMDGGADHEAN